MIYPVAIIAITTLFSPSHKAIDLGWVNTPKEELYSMNDGVVEDIYYISDGGNVIKINYGDGYISYYMHCSSFTVSIGQRVKKGSVVAYMGTTGHVSGPHCHLVLTYYGEAVDPVRHVYVATWQSVSSGTSDYNLLYEKEEIKINKKKSIIYYIKKFISDIIKFFTNNKKE